LEEKTMTLDFDFSILENDILFVDRLTPIAAIGLPINQTDNITADYHIIPTDQLLDSFQLPSWVELGRLYGISDESWTRDPMACIQAIKDRLLTSNLTINNGSTVCLACKLNLSIIQYKDALGYGYSKVRDHLVWNDPIALNTVKPVTSKSGIEARLKTPGKKRSTFVKHQARSTHGSIQDDGFPPLSLIVSRKLQVRIEPTGFKGDSVICKILCRMLPTTAWDEIGVVKVISKKRLLFDMRPTIPSLPIEQRERLLNLLSELGLIAGEVVKDSNLPFKGKCKFYDSEFQEFLGVELSQPSNPTQPYTVVSDRRVKRATVSSPIQHNRVDVQRYDSRSTVKSQNEKLRDEVYQLRKRLKKAERYADRAQQELSESRFRV